VFFGKIARDRSGVRRVSALLVTALVAAGVAGAQTTPTKADAGRAAQPPTAQPAPCQETLTELYQRLAPSVVLITASSVNPYDMDHRIQRVSGSGFIIDKSGLIITNAHVAFGRQILTVTLDNGVSLPAQMIGADPVFDIAVIRIPMPSKGDLPVAILADSDAIEVGHDVFALGNPMGLNQTLTRGIVSAVNRVLPGTNFSLTEPLIQTDAAINPGNSGGPLLTRCGEVAGINTAVVPDAQNIGFAVPANLVKLVLPALLRDGRLMRTWVGVQGQFVAPALKQLLRVPLVDGFLVEAVEPGSPAERAGIHDGEFEMTISGQPLLLGGDIITELNGVKISEPDSLSKVLQVLRIGDKVHVTVVRDGKPASFDLVAEERPVLPMDLPGRRVGSSVGAAAATSGGPSKGVIVF